MRKIVKRSHNAEKTERDEDSLGFSNIHSVATLPNIEEGTLVGKNSKKSRTMLKNWKGDPLDSPGNVC